MTEPATPALDGQVTFLYADDPDATWPFYEEVLRLPLALDQGLCRIYRTGPSSYLGVCGVRPGRQSNPAGVVVSLLTADVDGWHKRLQAAAIVIEGPPVLHRTFNVYGFFFRDPNGYLLEFQEFRDTAWPGNTAGDQRS
ncbi:MAG: VOC family protein [Alphaproteobacteria bacterium]